MKRFFPCQITVYGLLITVFPLVACEKGVTPDNIDEYLLYTRHRIPEIRQERTIERLVKQCVSDQEALRESARQRLMEYGDAVIPQVQSLVRSGSEEEQRVGLSILAGFHRPDLSAFYQQFITLTIYPTVQVQCLRALEPYREPSHVEFFRTWTKANVLMVRAEAARILGDWKEPVAVDTLVNLLDDPDTIVRTAALTALGRIGDRRAVPPLVRHGGRIRDHELATEKIALIGVLERLKDRRAGGVLRKMLFDIHSSSIRLRSADALAEIGDTSAIPGLIAVLDDPHPEVFRAARRALVRLTGMEFMKEGDSFREVQIKTQRAWREWWNRRTL